MDYHPDWLGAIIAGVLVGLSILAAMNLVPRGKKQVRAVISAGLIGVALAYIIRIVLRRFGI